MEKTRNNSTDLLPLDMSIIILSTVMRLSTSVLWVSFEQVKVVRNWMRKRRNQRFTTAKILMGWFIAVAPTPMNWYLVLYFENGKRRKYRGKKRVFLTLNRHLVGLLKAFNFLCFCLPTKYNFTPPKGRQIFSSICVFWRIGMIDCIIDWLVKAKIGARFRKSLCSQITKSTKSFWLQKGVTDTSVSLLDSCYWSRVKRIIF